MFSYRYSYMKMNDLQQGSDKISRQEVLQNYMMAPLKMHMQMHMFGAMYVESAMSLPLRPLLAWFLKK